MGGECGPDMENVEYPWITVWSMGAVLAACLIYTSLPQSFRDYDYEFRQIKGPLLLTFYMYLHDMGIHVKNTEIKFQRQK